MRNKQTWQQEQEALENAFARQLLLKYNIKEVTTQRQALNGTREFEFPVPSHPRYYNGNLRLACFKSGTVRKQNATFLTENGLKTNEYVGTARALIWSQLARMNYMLEYYLRNYNTNTK
jgi:hypothetical protein